MKKLLQLYPPNEQIFAGACSCGEPFAIETRDVEDAIKIAAFLRCDHCDEISPKEDVKIILRTPRQVHQRSG